uniref:Uncharacterized protein n=1 Tax=Prevotella sp. GTC17253 TaxID=3236793 RepID=A0AB33IUX7_9BACT
MENENTQYENYSHGEENESWWNRRSRSGCLDTGLKVGCGFVLGVVVTCVVLTAGFFVFSPLLEYVKQDDGQQTEKVIKDYEWFELSTKKGVVRLHTSMPKDSVKLLMGRPSATSVSNSGRWMRETWEYMGRNQFSAEFTLEFEDGELQSVSQYRE